MKSKYNFVFFVSKFDYYKYMFSDILESPDIETRFYQDFSDFLGPVLRKIYFNIKIPCVQRFCIRQAYKKISFNNDKPICFIYFAIYIPRIREGMVEEGRKVNKNSRHVAYFTDYRYTFGKNLETMVNNMDCLGVFDPSIAKKQNIHFWPFPYPDVKKVDNIEYDIYLTSMNDDRREKIERIAETCKEKGIRYCFNVFVPPKDRGDANIMHSDNINVLTEHVSYHDNIEYLKKSKCMLEITKKNTDVHYCTLRVTEAVKLNKKILTDNPNIFTMPCIEANRQNVQLYSDISKIDWDFVLDERPVEYVGDTSAYSCQTFINNIEEAIAEFEGQR